MSDNNKEPQETPEGIVGNYERVTEADKHRPVTMQELKTWRNRTIRDLNVLLQRNQKDMITLQTRMALVWNGINAVIRAFTKKDVVASVDRNGQPRLMKLITEDDLRSAGQELMKEAGKNVDRMRASAASKTPPVGITQTPLEEFRDLLKERSVEESEETEEEETTNGDESA